MDAQSRSRTASAKFDVRAATLIPTPPRHIVWSEDAHGALLAGGGDDPRDQRSDSRFAESRVICEEDASTFLFSLAAIEAGQDEGACRQELPVACFLKRKRAV